MRYHDFIQDSARWDGLIFREDDIVISTPAKCGTTWTQRLVSLLLGVEPTPERPLSVISPWLDMLTRPLQEVIDDLEAQEHRRFIKTHTPLDGLPWDDRATYVAVGRDPRDVAISWAHHYDNMELDAFVSTRVEAVGVDDLDEVLPDGAPPPPPTDPRERFWAWVEQADGMLPRLLHHLETFWAARDRPNVHLFHYADLKADLPAQIRRLAAALDVEVDAAGIERIAAAAGFERMRRDADLLIPNRDVDFWKDRTGFFRNGSSGQWRELFTEDDLGRYHEIVDALVPPDLARWIHAGGPVTGDV